MFPDKADQLMRAGLARGVFPGAVLLFIREGEWLFFRAYGEANRFTGETMRPDTLFDLASLTKPLATTLAVMKLCEMGKLEIDTPLGRLFDEFGPDKAKIRIRHLLAHTAGLPAHQPYYRSLMAHPPDRRKPILRQWLVQEPMVRPAGQAPEYSDLGFMILEWAIERAAGQGLARFVKSGFYEPLDIGLGFGTGAITGWEDIAIAATEHCPWRKRLLRGEVHDENTWAVGGVCGQAGLFGSASDLGRLLEYLLAAYHGKGGLVSPESVRTFFKPQQNAGRALGFDTPSGPLPGCGHLFSANTVGHLGFTGTSFWMDLDQSIIAVLLTNRVHPSRNNQGIRAFRPRIHDLLMRGI